MSSSQLVPRLIPGISTGKSELLRNGSERKALESRSQVHILPKQHFSEDSEPGAEFRRLKNYPCFLKSNVGEYFILFLLITGGADGNKVGRSDGWRKN